MKKIASFFLIFSLFVIVGCANNTARTGVLDADSETQLKLRQMQTRYYDISDKQKTMQAVMATLQDLGFIINKASLELGSISATKLDGYVVKMTVNVMPRGKDQMTVRANAQYNITPIDDPAPYQSFFNALSKSLFLQAHLEE